MKQKDMGLAQYRHMVEEISGSGWHGRLSEEVVRLQKKLKHALAFVPRGDSEVFAFEDGDTAEYGSETPYSEFQLAYLAQAMPLAMSCINRLHSQVGNEDVEPEQTIRNVIRGTLAILANLHQRVEAGDEVCLFTGKMRDRPIWIMERDEEHAAELHERYGGINVDDE